MLQTVACREAQHTSSSVFMVGERPPCTQNILLSMSAERLHPTWAQPFQKLPGRPCGMKLSGIDHHWQHHK